MRKLTLVFNIADDQDVSPLTEIASFMSWSDLSEVRDQQKAEIDRLKAELEEAKILSDEYKIICDAQTRQKERYENIYRREFEAKQLKAAEAEIAELDATLSQTKRQQPVRGQRWIILTAKPLMNNWQRLRGCGD